MLATKRNVNEISASRAADFLRNETGGRIVSVWFEKKDGSMRKMICRRGVKSHLAGGELPYDPRPKLLLTVFDMKAGQYRMVNLDTLVSFNVSGETFIVT
jgi:hypothetical protein